MRIRIAKLKIRHMIGQALLVALSCALLFLLPSIALADEPQKNVLLFNSDDLNLPASVLVNQAIRSTFKEHWKSPIQIYDEGQDSFRIPNEKYEAELVRLLQRKYEGVHFDLVLALAPPALRFLVKHRDELFPNAPIIFMVNDQSRIADLDLGSNITGVSGKIEVTPTLDLALALHPQTQRVVVVAGNARLDRDMLAMAQKEFRAYEGKASFTYLTDLTPEQIRQRLAVLPDKALVIYLSFNSDTAGNAYVSADVVSMLAQTSSAPIYAQNQAHLGRGIVGGRLLSYEAIGLAVGQMGARILAGESAQNIAPQTVPSVTMFDWRQLRRWGINESSVPAGSIVRFRQPTFWEQYKWRITGVVSLIILQALLIVWLLVNRASRQKAEAASRASEQRYRNVVDTQTELICRFLPDTTLTFVNDAYCRHFGKTREQLIGTKYIQLIPEHAREAALNHVASLIENPRVEIYEHEVVLPTGGRGWQQWVDNLVGSSNGHGIELQGIGRDITQRREAEQALRSSETRFQTLADNAPLLIWMSGPDKLCTYLNQGWLDFTGRTLDEELGRGWAEGVFHEDYPRAWELYESAFERRAPVKVEYRLRRADGVFRWVYVSATPRCTPEGEFLGYIGSCIDISDRKEAEEALRNAHEEVNKLKNQLLEDNIYLQEEIKLAHNVDEILGESDAIKYVLFKIEQVAQTDTTVLILGETGTGKELVARAIHSQSLRKDRPLVKVNCAALSASLIESELFGHEKGAFTGASARKVGRFELADGATIFLDEIGELPLDLQPKLLRVIQEGELERLGSSKTIKVDVRIIAATNRNMKLEVEKGTFREDLWYRLNVFPITVPPLRQRKEDIPPMIEHFVTLFSKKIGKAITSISAVTFNKLQDYFWPGNVRELANVIERGVINAQGPVLHIVDQFAHSKPPGGADLSQTLEQLETEHIRHVLHQTAWRIEGPSGAARILGLNPSTLRTRMQKLGIQKSVRTVTAGSETTR